MGVDWDFDLMGVFNAIAHAAPAVQVVIAASIGLWFVANRLIAWLDGREKRRARAAEEVGKAKRAEAFRELLTGVASQMQDLNARGTDALREVGARLEGLTYSVSTLQRTVQDVRDRQAQVIGRTESLAIVEDKFVGFIRAEVSDVLDQSMRRNAYEERREFVRDRVKTAIGAVVGQARQSLEQDYRALSVDLSPFFPERGGGQGGVRYDLVDRLWDAAEPLYRSHERIDARVEEMRLVVRNLIADHVTAARATAADVYSCPAEHLTEGEKP